MNQRYETSATTVSPSEYTSGTGPATLLPSSASVVVLVFGSASPLPTVVTAPAPGVALVPSKNRFKEKNG